MICLCRYGTGQRPLLPYEPHLSVDITSSGESSSGFTSQDSTMERCKTGTSPCCITTAIINIFFINSGSHDHLCLKGVVHSDKELSPDSTVLLSSMEF